MKLVLLSGGSGKRLWPMSNDSRSKQFLKVLSDPDATDSVSMLQRVWKQIGRVGLAQEAFICASRAQTDIILAQVGEASVIVEPSRRDTFPAIALCATYLLDVAGCDDNEIVAVLPVDQYVDDHFFQSVVQVSSALQEAEADLALLGVTPSEPTSKFGYMRVGAGLTSSRAMYHDVQSFVEKPPTELAARLIRDGALWNCGVFCFRLGYIRTFLQNHGYPFAYDDLIERFADLPKRSFDYEVVEQARRIVVVPYSGAWQDLGTWSALLQKVGQEFVGLGQSVQCENTHVINELGIPVVAVGLQDVVVVATPDGILVSEREQSGRIKDVVSSMAGRPMFEERYWGSYRVLDYAKLDDGTEVLTKAIEIFPGKNISYQKHMLRTEVWTIIAGSGELVLGTRVVSVAPGDVIRVFPDQWHAIRAIEKLQIIEVQRGGELVEDDIVRRYESWNDIIQHAVSLTI